MNLGGRPTKWTPELQTNICVLIATGRRPEVAASVCGIVRSTYFDWMQQGAAGVEPYAGFRTAVLQAADIFESDATATILAGDEKGAGFGPAKAALEVLSRRKPRQWAPQVKLHVETVGNEITDVVERLSRDPGLHARICAAKDSSEFFAAFCAEMSRLDSEEEAE